jgi:hypothetical protein
MRPAGVVALLWLDLVACSPPVRKETPLMNDSDKATDDDAKLVARVRAAVQSGVGANELAGFVGQKPLIDTTAGSSLASLQGVDFAADPAHPDERFDRNARAVVYWRRSVPGDDPHVVGVQVGDENKARVFFAIILPPG